MDTIIKYLDESLDYVSHELKGDTLHITVMSNLESVICPDCMMKSNKVHCRYKKVFKTCLYREKKL